MSQYLKQNRVSKLAAVHFSEEEQGEDDEDDDNYDTPTTEVRFVPGDKGSCK